MREDADQCGDAVGYSCRIVGQVLGQDRFARGRRGDVRVAVAVAADPAAETDHRRHVDAVKIRGGHGTLGGSRLQSSIDPRVSRRTGTSRKWCMPMRIASRTSGREGGPRQSSWGLDVCQIPGMGFSLMLDGIQRCVSASLLSKIRRIGSADRPTLGFGRVQ